MPLCAQDIGLFLGACRPWEKVFFPHFFFFAGVSSSSLEEPDTGKGRQGRTCGLVLPEVLTDSGLGSPTWGCAWHQIRDQE